MFVLSRKEGEEVLVPEFGIVFTIAHIRRDRVRVGVSAPTDVQVYRREVWERMENGKAEKEVISCAGSTGKPRKKG